jgi:hypothetical protein
MSRQLSLRTIGTRCVVFAIELAVFGILLASSAQAQTNWIISVDATGSGRKPTYHVAPTIGGCPFQLHQDPQNLHVCPGDKVQWQVISTKKKSELYIDQVDTIFDQSGASPKGFHASDDQPTDSAQIKSNSSLVGGHEYSVSAVDKDTNRLYVDDPKIIIGRAQQIYLRTFRNYAAN